MLSFFLVLIIWKKAREKFDTHVKSDLHKQAVLKVEVSQQESVMNRQAMSEQKVHQQMQLSSLKFLLRQGLAVRGYDDLEGNLLQLLKLRSNDCTDLAMWVKERKYFSPVILNEQIALMGLTILRGLLSDIKEAHWFSIIADEATDVSNKEQLTLCVRWVDKELVIHEDPLELIHVPKTDSNTLTSVLKDCLIRFCLPISQCRGQAYDGASNMSGHLNGVAAQIEKVVPAALYLHCFAHCTNLCLQTVGRQCAPVRHALDLVMGISQLIRYSPKRTTLFLSLQSQLSPGSMSLKPLCPTRWTVRTSAISSVLTNYAAALEEINAETHDDYGIKAGGYLAQMESFSTYFGLKLSHLVFSGAEQLSLTLQGKDTTIQEATMAAEVMIQYLQRQRTDACFTKFYAQVVEDSKDHTSPPVLPRSRRPPKRIDDSAASVHEYATPEDFYRRQYFEVLDLLINELRRRFQQKRGLPVVAVLEKVLLDSANGESNLESADFPEEFQLYKSDVDLAKLKTQLLMLPDLIKTRNLKVNSPPIRKVTNVRTICDIMNEVGVAKELFSEVFRLLLIFYTLPVTTSTAERTFSALRRLKTYLRSTMSQPRLNHTMLLYIHKERTDQIDEKDVAKKFIAENDRRRSYFGNVLY